MADTSNRIASTFSAALTAVPTDRRLGIAVSGGGDSIALLHLTAEWASKHGADIHVATVDHGLRPESHDEAQFVQRVCTEHQIPHSILTLSQLRNGKGNLSARARTARYDKLSEWAHHIGIQQVFLGHTMDDQAETVLMRLARGSGAEGLSGMAASMTWGNVLYLRPLLNLRRQELRDWLVEQTRDWVEDPSNDDLAYDRIKARTALTALAPIGITVEGLVDTSIRLSRQRLVLEDAAETLEQAAVTGTPEGLSLDRAMLRVALADTGMRVFANAIMRVGLSPYRPRFRSLEPAYQRLISTEQTTLTLGGCLVKLDKDHIIIRSEATGSKTVTDIHNNGNQA